MPWVPPADHDGPKPSRKELEEIEFALKTRIRARFLVDESVPQALIALLRKRGVGILTAADARLKGHSDQDYVAFAKRDERAIVSCDGDFLDFQKFPLLGSPVIAVLDLGAGSNPELKRAVALLGRMIRFPRFYDIDARLYVHCSGEWIEWHRYLDGSSDCRRYRSCSAGVEVWEDDRPPRDTTA